MSQIERRCLLDISDELHIARQLVECGYHACGEFEDTECVKVVLNIASEKMNAIWKVLNEVAGEQP